MFNELGCLLFFHRNGLLFVAVGRIYYVEDARELLFASSLTAEAIIIGDHFGPEIVYFLTCSYGHSGQIRAVDQVKRLLNLDPVCDLRNSRALRPIIDNLIEHI